MPRMICCSGIFVRAGPARSPTSTMRARIRTASSPRASIALPLPCMASACTWSNAFCCVCRTASIFPPPFWARSRPESCRYPSTRCWRPPIMRTCSTTAARTRSSSPKRSCLSSSRFSDSRPFSSMSWWPARRRRRRAPSDCASSSPHRAPSSSRHRRCAMSLASGSTRRDRPAHPKAPCMCIRASSRPPRSMRKRSSD